jgi:hypothetical protein
MKNVSIDIADRYGEDFRRLLRSADRLRDRATASGVALANAPLSRSSASLFAATAADQRRGERARGLRCVFRASIASDR